MALYKVSVMPSVDKDIKSIPEKDRKRILKRIDALANNPRPRGCKKLVGKNHYRVQQGDYRIIYEIQYKELVVWVIEVGNRKDIYRVSEEKKRYLADKQNQT